MFPLLLLLGAVAGLHADLHPHKIFLQTTVPEKISSSNAKKDPENNVAYVITIEGRPYFVHLKKQSFLSSTSVIYSYDKDDAQHSEPLLDQMDCNYNGYVAGFPNSLVTLSTCSGLRGTIQFKNISYGIEPLEAVSGFVHMIYEERSDNTNIPLLGENDTYSWFENSQYQVRKSSERTEFTRLFPRYLQMHIVVDKNLFVYMGSDIKAVTQKVIEIIGLVNTMLTQLKLTVVISSIEIWSNKNKISTLGLPDNVLFRFLEWRNDHLNLQQHNIAYLLAFKKHPTFTGATFSGSVCDKNYAAGIALYPEGFSLESYTAMIVQLLGLNLGLTYDNTDTCYCSGDVCTMTPKAVYSGGIKDFSTCSLDEFKYFASRYGLDCLRENPFDMPVYRQAQKKICGNGILEGDEECDCGTKENCTHKSCCDPASCKLKGNIVCGSGECCTKDCKLKPVNTPCRKPTDECDFAEFCNGKDPHCVPDTYAHNGRSCDSGGAFCYNGICRTFVKQCRNLVGGDSRGGSFACYEEINSRTDRYGNCGRNFCPFGDLLCGKLVCAWPHKTFISRANLSVIYAHVLDETCVSTFRPHHALSEPGKSLSVSTYYRPEDRDDTFVEDGSVCGPDMFCVRMSCREVRFHINSTCVASRDCNLHGICNNFNHCHCDKGFYPPNCKPRKGEFGSIDDGHMIKTGKSYLEGRHVTLQKHQFRLIFYVSLPVFIITVAVLITQTKLRKLCYRGETENLYQKKAAVTASYPPVRGYLLIINNEIEFLGGPASPPWPVLKEGLWWPHTSM
ncbi:disintegrin and metalloproteinase domain-containing protein 5-like [Cynocephalus volans]|uniref:disintegrin and metalloproteinase domain-containing protein 5-like n=1 Tax=Cynocephalus volans TaxID=110931 RepID=UPI002FC83832